MRICIVALMTFLAIVLTGALQAHPGHEHVPDLRVWKDADGLFEIEASFVLLRGDQVQLCKHDGTMVWVPLAKLSGADRVWVSDRVGAVRRLNGVHTDSDASPGSDDRSNVARTIGVGSMPAAAVFGLALLAVAAKFLCRKLAVLPFVGLALAVASLGMVAVGKEQEKAPPAIMKHFEPFKHRLTFRWDDDFLYIGCNGLPDHPMMVGITAWQQQVPLPQPYTGTNAWRIPLKPKMAAKPISAKNALFRGAIAVAANGVPIFNALNNRGEDSFLIGELDEFGGHCGKGDDYHYHIAPLHLQKIVGQGNPIGYALDGYPLYGLTDDKLDEFNGKFDDKGNYLYHSTKKYPYINGGLRGVVEVRNDGVEPQPHAFPARPAGKPLRGAKITGFTVDDEKKNFSLKYEVKGETRKINYKINANGTVTFVFIDERGTEQTETFSRREGGKGGDKKGDDKKGKDKKKKD